MNILVDVHVHLDLYDDPVAAVDDCIKNGVYALCVTTTPKAWAGTSALVKRAPRVRCAVGLHPQLAHERRAELPLLMELMGATPYLGEVGLDGAMPSATHPSQRTVLGQALQECDRRGGRVVSLHSRRATTDTLDVLHRHSEANLLIMHWFTGTTRELARAIEMGCWFSVGPAMTSTQRGRALIERMPRDRLLTETDGPFTKANGRPLSPVDVANAVPVLAASWKVDLKTAHEQVRSNFMRMAEFARGRSWSP